MPSAKGPKRGRVVTDLDIAASNASTAASAAGSASAAPKANAKAKARRRRRTNQGREPAQLKVGDNTVHVLSIMSRLLLQVTASNRLLSGLMLTTVIMFSADEPAASSLGEQKAFKTMLQDARDKTSPGDPPPAVGAPHVRLFLSFITALAKLQVGQKSKNVLDAWLATVAGGAGTSEVPEIINESCQAFNIFPVANNNEKSRLQIAMSTGPIRVAVLCALNQIERVVISTGPAPKGYLEEELEEWLSVMRPNRA